jgi:hypothetical protein
VLNRVAGLSFVWLVVALAKCEDGTNRGACEHAATRDGQAPGGCNGSASLCDRRYDQVTYATAHNAMSNADEGWYRPNQRHGIERALGDGVRGLMLDAHVYRGEVYLCHARCELGRRPIRDALCGVHAFLDGNPGEVVSLLIENHVPDEVLVEEFIRAGLEPYLHTQPPHATWPTLGAMVTSGRRLVVFIESGGGAPPWLHGLFEYSWDTPYSYGSVAEFNCVVGRGRRAESIFTINHFLTDTFGDEALARAANDGAVLRSRVRQCEAEQGRRPTFLAVDYYETGSLLEVVRELNGL